MFCFVASFLRSSSPRKLHRQASVYQRPTFTKQHTVCGTPSDDEDENTDQELFPGQAAEYAHVEGMYLVFAFDTTHRETSAGVEDGKHCR